MKLRTSENIKKSTLNTKIENIEKNERRETKVIKVVKKDGTKEVFDRQKLLAGLIKSCYKRPVTADQLEDLTKDIESELINALKTEVPSKEIGTMAMERLRELDEVSYVRFASVYREFKDVETFMRELETLKNEKDEKAAHSAQH